MIRMYVTVPVPLKYLPIEIRFLQPAEITNLLLLNFSIHKLLNILTQYSPYIIQSSYNGTILWVPR